MGYVLFPDPANAAARVRKPDAGDAPGAGYPSAAVRPGLYPGAQICAGTDETLRRWLAAMGEAGIRVMILSNNRSPVRVERFCRDLGIDYVGHAGKPSSKGFRAAMEKAGVTPQQTAMLGDKLLTDVLGANRSGVLAVMVEPMGGPKGAWNHILHGLQKPFKARCKERK